MSPFLHPTIDQISITNVLSALGDPVRLSIVRILYKAKDGCNCSEAAPFDDVPRSTLSGHFKVLRESGVITTHKRGTEHINTLRRKDLDSLFPNLLNVVLKG